MTAAQERDPDWVGHAASLGRWTRAGVLPAAIVVVVQLVSVVGAVIGLLWVELDWAELARQPEVLGICWKLAYRLIVVGWALLLGGSCWRLGSRWLQLAQTRRRGDLAEVLTGTRRLGALLVLATVMGFWTVLSALWSWL